MTTKYVTFTGTEDVYKDGELYAMQVGISAYNVREVIANEEGFILAHTLLKTAWFTNEELEEVLNEYSIEDATVNEMLVMTLYSHFKDTHPILKEKVQELCYYADEFPDMMNFLNVCEEEDEDVWQWAGQNKAGTRTTCVQDSGASAMSPDRQRGKGKAKRRGE